MTTVLCFGTFDGLHQGHTEYFRQARKYGISPGPSLVRRGDGRCRLVVVVARDETVREVKGRLPRQDEETRLRAVVDHPLVDQAMLGQPDDKYRVIEDIRPDVIVLGYDQRAFTDDLETILRGRGLSCTVVRAKPHRPDLYKSSKLQL